MEQMDLINLPPPEKTETKKQAPQLTVSGAELADWLCVTPAAITQGRSTSEGEGQHYNEEHEHQQSHVDDADAPARPVPTTMTSSFSLFLGFTSRW